MPEMVSYQIAGAPVYDMNSAMSSYRLKPQLKELTPIKLNVAKINPDFSTQLESTLKKPYQKTS